MKIISSFPFRLEIRDAALAWGGAFDWRAQEARINSFPQLSFLVVEVMVDAVDPKWWSAFRRRLEKRLRQKEIVVRAHEIRHL